MGERNARLCMGMAVDDPEGGRALSVSVVRSGDTAHKPHPSYLTHPPTHHQVTYPPIHAPAGGGAGRGAHAPDPTTSCLVPLNAHTTRTPTVPSHPPCRWWSWARSPCFWAPTTSAAQHSIARFSHPNPITPPPSLQVVELDAEPMPLGPDNKYGIGFVTKSTVLETEQQAQRMGCPEKSRTWKVCSE